MFIEPVKRSSTFKKFSKHENILTSPDNRFALQKRKKQDSAEHKHHNFRIILLGNPYYEIAYSDELNQLKEREWRYLTEELPRRIPDSKSEKELVGWFLAHFTCLAMELGGDKIQPDDSDDDDEHSVLGGSSIANIPSSATLLYDNAHLPVNDKHYFSPSGVNQPGFVLPPQNRHHNDESKLYPASTYPLRGLAPFIVSLVLINGPLMLLREVNDGTFTVLIALVNCFVFSTVLFGVPFSFGISRLVSGSKFSNQQSAAQTAPSTNSTANASKSADASASTDIDEPAAPRPAPTSPEQAVAELLKPGGPSQVTSKGITPGVVLNQSQQGKVAVNTYSDCQAQSWALRCGPNYALHKAKAPSGPAMFDLLGLDCFASKNKIVHIAKYVNFEPLYTLPKVPYVDLDSSIDQAYKETMEQHMKKPLEHCLALDAATKEELGRNWVPPSSPTFDPSFDPTGAVKPKGELLPGFHWGSIEKPFVFIINMQVPTYAPSYMGGGTDGEGMNLVWYLRATPETQRDLLRPEPVCPAVRVLKKYILANPTDADYQKNMDRFKNIPRLVNVQEFDFGWTTNKLISQYNAKPFLTRPQGVLHRGPGYANFDLDIHCFCYMAKKVLHSFLDKMDKVVLDWGFCVEAFGDEEQPEVMIGQIRLFKIQFQSFPSWDATLTEVAKAKSDPTYDTTHPIVYPNAGVTRTAPAASPATPTPQVHSPKSVKK